MKSELLLVKTDVLPEVFGKVVEAKHLLSCKKAKSASEAAKMCGISRSAFYKYKDSVFSYNELNEGSVVNLSAVLEDRAGVLSQFLSVLYETHANILTVNQGMPSGGVASVTVSYRDESGELEVNDVINHLMRLEGVVSINRVLGEL